MKRKGLFTLLFFTGSIFTACENEDETPPAKPEITILELGSSHSNPNDHMASVGGEFHMEAEIVAEGKIDIVQVLVHPEGEHDEEEGHEEWEIDTTYTKFSGLLNTLFHEHLDVDDTAEPGDYHVDFIVTDMEGNQSSTEAELEIIEN